MRRRRSKDPYPKGRVFTGISAAIEKLFLIPLYSRAQNLGMPPPGGNITNRRQPITAQSHPYRAFSLPYRLAMALFHIFCICLCCLMTRPLYPESATGTGAMRRLREPLMMSGYARSCGVHGS